MAPFRLATFTEREGTSDEKGEDEKGGEVRKRRVVWRKAEAVEEVGE